MIYENLGDNIKHWTSKLCNTFYPKNILLKIVFLSEYIQQIKPKTFMTRDFPRERGVGGERFEEINPCLSCLPLRGSSGRKPERRRKKGESSDTSGITSLKLNNYFRYYFPQTKQLLPVLLPSKLNSFLLSMISSENILMKTDK